MTCSFRVGQKVVAVRGGARPNQREINIATAAGYQKPKIGDVLTIRSINDWGNDKIILTFNELDNSHFVPRISKMEPGWHYSHFRPLVERKTDISIFKAMLMKTRVGV